MDATLLPPTAENFRTEIARYRILRSAICEVIDMNPNMLTMYTSGYRALAPWAAHNIGFGINVAVGEMIFEVDMQRGVLPAPTPADYWSEQRQRHPATRPWSRPPRKTRRTRKKAARL